MTSLPEFKQLLVPVAMAALPDCSATAFLPHAPYPIHRHSQLSRTGTARINLALRSPST
jgi:hypothetical protein